MDKKNIFNFNDYYIEQKQKEIRKLDKKKKEYENEIEKQNELIEKNKNIIEKINFYKSINEDKYESLKRIFESRGIILNIPNNNYNIKEWDNLYFQKKEKLIKIICKDRKELKVFDSQTSKVIGDLIKEKNYSLVVLRVEKRNIKVQFHIK